ncbi:MAG: GNAT family N-acetyltransferase [Alphaproteobacteria bacterium]
MAARAGNGSVSGRAPAGSSGPSRFGRWLEPFLGDAHTTLLTAERVYLRPPRLGDFDGWARVRHGSRAFLAPWEPTWPEDALSRGAYRRRLASYGVDWRKDTGYNFFVFARADDALLGGIGLANLRRGVVQSASLGYWMGVVHAGQGYMTEALGAVLAFSFDRLHLHRLEAACLPSNMASRRLLGKCGFREEGYARKYLCINGVWQDHVLFGQLAEEWRPPR